MKKDLRGTWPQALWTFFGPILLVVLVRWLLVEPFVIPSGSMIPTLEIHDHIFVNKMAYGVHSPFENSFWLQWQHPEAGDIVVFRYPENPEVFYVKRVVAVGGDELSVNKGIISVNGHPYSQVPIQMKPADNVFDYFEEKSTHPYVVRYKNRDSSFFDSVKVPAGSIFVMGDNRDQSNDSRYWGFVPEGNLLGTAKIVWLACEQTLPSAQFLCDPTTIRFDRLLKKLR